MELICNMNMDIRKSVSYINKFYPNGSQQLGDKCSNTLKYNVLSTVLPVPYLIEDSDQYSLKKVWPHGTS
jgi:hypothetical protein